MMRVIVIEPWKANQQALWFGALELINIRDRCVVAIERLENLDYPGPKNMTSFLGLKHQRQYWWAYVDAIIQEGDTAG